MGKEQSDQPSATRGEGTVGAKKDRPASTRVYRNRRHWFSKPVLHHTHGGVNVLNLVAGNEAVVESPDGCFQPFCVHYAETFIVPANVGAYQIRPVGSGGETICATLKAFVREQ
ncbi:MAG: hypothetical protein U1F83_06890 [Verrucomicrobiota bacterium]